MNIREWEGNKYPDEYIIRMFFKNELDTKTNLKVIEFGCEKGINLKHFADWGYSVTGIDINPGNILSANRNFQNYDNDKSRFYCNSIQEILKNRSALTEFDIVLFPSCLYYMQHKEIIIALENLNVNNGTWIYIRMRTPDDYRNESKARDRKIKFNETNEVGLTVNFYESKEIEKLIENNYEIKNKTVLHTTFENIQGEEKALVHNSDFIIWGQLWKK